MKIAIKSHSFLPEAKCFLPLFLVYSEKCAEPRYQNQNYCLLKQKAITYKLSFRAQENQLELSPKLEQNAGCIAKERSRVDAKHGLNDLVVVKKL